MATHDKPLGQGGDGRAAFEVEGAAHGKSLGQGCDGRASEVEVAAHCKSLGQGGDGRAAFEVEGAAHGKPLGQSGDARFTEVEVATHGKTLRQGSDAYSTEVEEATEIRFSIFHSEGNTYLTFDSLDFFFLCHNFRSFRVLLSLP